MRAESPPRPQLLHCWGPCPGDQDPRAASPSWAIFLSVPHLSWAEQAAVASLPGLGGLNASQSFLLTTEVQQQMQSGQFDHSVHTTPPAWPQESRWGCRVRTLLCLALTTMVFIFGLNVCLQSQTFLRLKKEWGGSSQPPLIDLEIWQHRAPIPGMLLRSNTWSGT